MQKIFYEFPIEVYDNDEAELTRNKDIVKSVARIKLSEIESYYWSPVEETTYIFMKSFKWYNVQMEFGKVKDIVENTMHGTTPAEPTLCGSCGSNTVYQCGDELICELCGFKG